MTSLRPQKRLVKKYRSCLLAIAIGHIVLTLTTNVLAAQNSTKTQPITSSLTDRFCPKSAISTSTKPAEIKFTKLLELPPLTPNFGIHEGPVWFNGKLLFSTIGLPVDDKANPSNLLAYHNGAVQVMHDSYGSNGLAIDQHGQLVAARHQDGSITQVVTGKILAKAYQGARFNSPNDLSISSQGHIYFTDPDWQAPKNRPQASERVYHVDTAGTVTAFAGNIVKPNGITLSLDEAYVYVGGMNGLFKFKIRPNGGVEDQAIPVLAQEIPSGIDGLGKDCAGNLYVTNEGRLSVVSTQKGEKSLSHTKLEGITNVAFGGEDGKTLFVTTLGNKPQLWSAPMNIPGFPY